jgi:hypothetical protein
MKKILLLVSLLALCFCGCYHSIRESLICPWLSLPETLKAQGLGRYNDKTIDIDWLDNELSPDSVEMFISRAVPQYYSTFFGADPERQKKVIADVIAQSIKKWEQYKKDISKEYRIAYYHKSWFYEGSAAGIVILNGCVIVADIHFPEIKGSSGELL